MNGHCVAANIHFRAIVQTWWTFHIFCKERPLQLPGGNGQEISEPHQYRGKVDPSGLSQSPPLSSEFPPTPQCVSVPHQSSRTELDKAPKS